MQYSNRCNTHDSPPPAKLKYPWCFFSVRKRPNHKDLKCNPKPVLFLLKDGCSLNSWRLAMNVLEKNDDYLNGATPIY